MPSLSQSSQYCLPCSLKKRIEEEIQKFKVDKGLVKSQLPATTTMIPLSGSVFAISGDLFHRYTKCGFGYVVKKLGGLPGIAFKGKTAAQCPKCGNVDEIK